MSVQSVLIQVLASGGASALATGLVLQRAKSRDDLRQWHRDRMLDAVSTFCEASTVAHRAAQSNIRSLDFRDRQSVAEREGAYNDARNDCVATRSRVGLLFGHGSATLEAVDRLLVAHWGVHDALTNALSSPGDVIPDADAEALREAYWQKLNALYDNEPDVWVAARREIADPPALSREPVRSAKAARESPSGDAS